MASGGERLFTMDDAVVEDPEHAVEELTAALEQNLDKAELYCQRACAHTLLQNFKDALEDANKALELKPNCAEAYLRKGVVEYHLEMYRSAMESFKRGQELDDDNDAFETWITKCNGNLSPTGQECVTAEEICAHNVEVPKLKYDWYQTESHIIITIMIKNAKKDDVNVEFTEGNMNATVKLSSEENYNLNLKLLHPIAFQHCITRVLGTKIEIKMKKTEAIRWESLEGEGIVMSVKHFTPDQMHQYPSSSHHTKNWDQLVMEIKEEEKNEKLEGDAALNQLFQKIYADGSDEVKRAMNKSFTESGGTVLSTNWSEVGNKQIAVSPPDDMEWKKL
ncbi:protein SGT1 homolog isoform X2 [Callorhinchus milii]|uniref:protein SGT1 homolog isoform X2 n=1 Tax=Callorhinchus milii TaxID=7868 RepID=UPI0004574AF8|nr:protein SGT1 homolog isoform X2 [Callorhinchus milii]|eukprot:gi/632952070/ref/XP_007891649.1/ PREDICTED: suppressor of G2 allele of SKP1 homolog isoform X2 [Callorhinchus milii]